MGNVMTPFFPPKAAFIPKVTNILASTSFSTLNGYFRLISHAEAESGFLYISGSATNAQAGTATTKTEYFDIATTTLTKVFTVNVGALTLATAFSYTLGITTGLAGTAVDFDVSTSFQFVYSATGYGTSGVPLVRKLSATNISFASN